MGITGELVGDMPTGLSRAQAVQPLRKTWRADKTAWQAAADPYSIEHATAAVFISAYGTPRRGVRAAQSRTFRRNVPTRLGRNREFDAALHSSGKPAVFPCFYYLRPYTFPRMIGMRLKDQPASERD